MKYFWLGQHFWGFLFCFLLLSNTNAAAPVFLSLPMSSHVRSSSSGFYCIKLANPDLWDYLATRLLSDSKRMPSATPPPRRRSAHKCIDDIDWRLCAWRRRLGPSLAVTGVVTLCVRVFIRTGRPPTKKKKKWSGRKRRRHATHSAEQLTHTSMTYRRNVFLIKFQLCRCCVEWRRQ